MQRVRIIKDLRILKKFEKLTKNNWVFDRKYKYNISNYTINQVEYNNKIYRLEYLSGCFCPYLVEYLK